MSSASTRVARLRIRDVGLDPHTTQRRAESVLYSTTWQLPELPGTAILCIRRFDDPSPGTLRFDRLDGPAPTSWQQAVTASLNSIARAAARPATGPVPAAANAVVFLDRAEMLACLARDWICGSTTLHWWWQTLLRDSDVAAAVPRSWLETPEHIPAAFQRLAASGDATRFIWALKHRTVHVLFERLARHFGLRIEQPFQHRRPNTEIVAKPDFPTGEDLRTRSPLVSRSRPEPGGTNILPDTESPTPPWRQWIGSAEVEQLAGERLALLVVGLLLIRAPVVVRRPSFLTEAITWWSEPSSPPDNRSANQEDQRSRPVGGPSESAPQRHGYGEHSEIPPSGQTSHYSTETPVDLPPTRRVVTSFRTGSVAIPDLSPIQVRPPSPEADEPILAPTGTSHVRADTPLPAPRADELSTDFGGVFYLVNVGLYLGLYGDFTEPLRPGLALPVWDFMALVGRDILGPRIEQDPVWEFLARLSGRPPNQPPGLGYAAPIGWPRPADWAHFVAATAPLAPEPTETVSEWIHWVMSYLRWRLARALALDSTEQLSHVLCESPATVSATDTHLEVRFALARLPVSVRRSGLDRDPGWVPAAGRYITFHYD